MSLTEKDIIKIAKLARIALPQESLPLFTKELSRILSMAENLQQVPTDDVPQMTSVSDLRLPMREDEITDGDKQDDVLANTPFAEYGCFVVPKVIE